MTNLLRRSKPTRKSTRTTISTLREIPNIGPSLESDLQLLGSKQPADLVGRDPFTMYRSLCALTHSRQDPCVLDVFLSAVAFMEGAPARPWWHYTPTRKRRWPDLA